MRNAARPSCAAAQVDAKRARIQLLLKAFGAGPSRHVQSPSRSSARRVAFQILLRKCLLPSMRLGASAMRLLLGGYVASVKRTASAPNAGNPLPIAAADGYARLNFASASASGAPGSVLATISANVAPCTR